MRGLSVGRTHGSARRSHQLTDFEEFFSSLYPGMRSYTWLLDGVHFRIPEAPDQWFDAETDRYRSGILDAFASGMLATDERALVARPGFVETYAKYLVDDWCDIVGLQAAPDDPQA